MKDQSQNIGITLDVFKGLHSDAVSNLGIEILVHQNAYDSQWSFESFSRSDKLLIILESINKFK